MANDTHPDSVTTLLQTLDDLVATTEANVERAAQIQTRVNWLRQELAAGVSVAEAVRAEPRPLVVELITENIDALQTFGSRMRWAEAAALYAEGLTMTEIADLFGVTRQRISALLKQQPVPDPN